MEPSGTRRRRRCGVRPRSTLVHGTATAAGPKRPRRRPPALWPCVGLKGVEVRSSCRLGEIAAWSGHKAPGCNHCESLWGASFSWPSPLIRSTLSWTTCPPRASRRGRPPPPPHPAACIFLRLRWSYCSSDARVPVFSPLDALGPRSLNSAARLWGRSGASRAPTSRRRPRRKSTGWLRRRRRQMSLIQPKRRPRTYQRSLWRR